LTGCEFAALIKALMVDVDGVLVTGRVTDGRHWAADLEIDLGLSAELLQSAFFEPHWIAIVTGQADIGECLTPVLAEIAPHVAAEQLLGYWFQADSKVNQELLDELATLRSTGLRVYLATNQEHARVDYLMSTLGFAARTDGCLYSAALGHRKPAKTFFDAAASKVRLPASELLLIDDSEENVQGAIDAGWHAVLWTGKDRIHDLLRNLQVVSSAI
jgi:putative hydrolase of the HAD superfamily